MQYEQAVHYLYSALPLFSRTGARAMKPGLENIARLCAYLNNPQERFKMIHVAGTNGKGSVCHMLSAVLMQNGYKTGLYTSPHLTDFRERIRINGEWVSAKFVTEFVTLAKPFIEEFKPSFFEITVGMALEYFARQQVDIAVIETGLGGRLDSTNIIVPVLSVITNIGLDHTDILGDTLAKIAREKAGIIKQGVPVVIGETGEETKPVFEETAAANQSPILFATDRFSVMSVKQSRVSLEAEVFDHATQQKEMYVLDLPGSYQQTNLLTVLAALEVLKQTMVLSAPKIRSALAAARVLTGFQGRWELLREHPVVVLDVAHNAEGMRALLHNITLQSYDRLRIVMGMVRDKPIDEVLLQMPKNATYYFTQAHLPRALPAQDLFLRAQAYTLQGQVYADVNVAVHDALRDSDSRDLIVVCGSVFLIGEVKRQAIENFSVPES